jgi:hypothetical protein
MTTPYATTDELAARLPYFDPADADQLEAAGALLQQATDYLVAECGDAEIVGAEPAARDFWGNGTAYLWVGPHTVTIAAEDIEAPSGYTAPTFVDRGEYLVAADAAGTITPGVYWPANVKYVVTATWGAATIDGARKSACLDLAVFWYVASHTDRPEQLATSDVPERVRKSIDRIRYAAAFARGVL